MDGGRCGLKSPLIRQRIADGSVKAVRKEGPNVLSKQWLKDAADRVISTGLFALIGYLVSVDHFDLWSVNWHGAINATVIAALGSLLKAGVVRALPIGTPDSATPVDLTPGKHTAPGNG